MYCTRPPTPGEVEVNPLWERDKGGYVVPRWWPESLGQVRGSRFRRCASGGMLAENEALGPEYHRQPYSTW